MKRSTNSLLAAAALATAFGAHGQAKVYADPMLPAYGTEVEVQLTSDYPSYMPATRYSVSGNQIVIDYEYLGVGFGPWTPDFGNVPLQLGEMVPGNYTITARLHDINQPAGSAPKVLTSSLAVVPPDSWGIYTVPSAPQARAATSVTIRSAAYFDPASMKATVTGRVVRVDFVYDNTAPTNGGPPREGMQGYGSVRIPSDLAPGSYTLEGWGRTATGAPEKFFQRSFTVAATTPVVEYYSPSLDHYFLSMNSSEIAALDRGAAGDYKRTGYSFKAYTSPSEAPAGAVPVCRFYAAPPRSHFFTANASECESLKQLEQRERAQDAAAGRPFMGWAYEGIAFYAYLPRDGACAGGLQPVYRSYNNRWQQNDSNHRFTTDPMQRSAMSVGWSDEGAQMCVPL